MRLSWFTSWLRPTIETLHVKLYVNGVETDPASFDLHRLTILCQAITDLWRTERGSPYWFQAEIVEYRKCFSPKKTSLELTCYTEDRYNPGLAVTTGIPNRYRKKMFDKRHPIKPSDFSTIHWPSSMEVRFVCLDV